MLKKIKTEQLQIGMYVVLPLSWTQHPFLSNRFKIKSHDQIREIIGCGLREVSIDTSRSSAKQFVLSNDPIPSLGDHEHLSHQDPVTDPKQEAPPTVWEPDKLVPEELTAALEDKQMSPEEKSTVVYQHSVQMMERLLESPTAENIRSCKKAVSAITDLILSDDDTANNLLKITSHDFYTYTHSVNVGVPAIMMAKALFRDSNAHDLHELGAGFFLHDLGSVNKRAFRWQLPIPRK